MARSKQQQPREEHERDEKVVEWEKEADFADEIKLPAEIALGQKQINYHQCGTRVDAIKVRGEEKVVEF